MSPKAIFTRDHYSAVRLMDSLKTVRTDPGQIEILPGRFTPGQFGTGDYFIAISGAGGIQRRRIIDNTADRMIISPAEPWQPPIQPDSRVEIQIRLQRVHVDIAQCIGCGICEHECPVAGKRAIRVTAENETRNQDHTLLLNETRF